MRENLFLLAFAATALVQSAGASFITTVSTAVVSGPEGMACANVTAKTCVEQKYSENEQVLAAVAGMTDDGQVSTAQSAEGGWENGDLFAKVSAEIDGFSSSQTFSSAGTTFTTSVIMELQTFSRSLNLRYVEFLLSDEGELRVPGTDSICPTCFDTGMAASFRRHIILGYYGASQILKAPSEFSERIQSSDGETVQEIKHDGSVGLFFAPGSEIALTTSDQVVIEIQYHALASVETGVWGTIGFGAAKFNNTSRIVGVKVVDDGDADVTDLFRFLAPDGSLAAFDPANTIDTPEPSTLLLSGLSLVLLGLLRAKQRNRPTITQQVEVAKTASGTWH